MCSRKPNVENKILNTSNSAERPQQQQQQQQQQPQHATTSFHELHFIFPFQVFLYPNRFLTVKKVANSAT